LRAVLDAQVPAGASGFVVAVSGGADSTALLAAMAALAATVDLGATPDLRLGFWRLPLRAVHIDHGLQAAAAEFREACGELCRRLEVPLTILPVVVSTPAGVSVEAAARDARYAALAGNLRAGECLLTAHHREDQAETLLLQALRGAGLRGMSAMPLCRPFGVGWHLRPVLDVAQHELLAFARRHGFDGNGNGHGNGHGDGSRDASRDGSGEGDGCRDAEGGGDTLEDASSAGRQRAAAPAADPMNEDLRFDRVYLRRRVWPLIETRWPGAGAALSRTARHVAEAQDLLERAAEADLGRLRDGEALSLPRLRALGQAERINAVRHWLEESGAEPPSTARLHEALRQLFEAEEDHLPAVMWGDCALRRYRDRMFLTAAQPPRLQGTRRWEAALGASVDLGLGLGALRWAAAPQCGGGIAPHGLPPFLSVRARSGGETLRPTARGKAQTVQHLCQSLGVLPWLRDALPFVFAQDVLIAVADLWQDASACSGPPGGENAPGEQLPAEPASGNPRWLIVWEGAPILV
jgi:tRNA(Ile)-lysidine synthase